MNDLGHKQRITVTLKDGQSKTYIKYGPDNRYNIAGSTFYYDEKVFLDALTKMRAVGATVEIIDL